MKPSTIVDIIRMARTSDRPALTFEGVTRSFSWLNDRSSRVAQGLLARGVRAGDRIAYLDRNRPEYFELLFGAAKIGAVCIAVNWRLSDREIAHVLADAGASVVFRGADLDDGYEDWARSFDPVDPGAVASSGTDALQLYTSGTTGLPKGVVLTNGNFYAMADAAGPAWGFHDDMVGLGVSPLFHIAGSGWNLMVLAHGGHVVLHREVDADAILRDVPACGVTHALLVPAILQMLLAAREAGGPDTTTLETVVYGASPISDDVLLALFDAFDCDFVQGYGLTETCGAVTTLAAADHDRTRPGLLRSCGRPLPGVSLRIADPDGGGVGEVQVRAGQVMDRYWNQPEATAEARTDDGWFRTGDAGYLLDGRLYLHDRIKDMIVSGAENVYPAEVENVLRSHPAVADVAVIGVPDERWGEAVKAVVVLAPGASLSPDELIAHARADLAAYKCPRSVDVVDELPRNPSGKVLKRELRAPYWAGRDRQING